MWDGTDPTARRARAPQQREEHHWKPHGLTIDPVSKGVGDLGNEWCSGGYRHGRDGSVVGVSKPVRGPGFGVSQRAVGLDVHHGTTVGDEELEARRAVVQSGGSAALVLAPGRSRRPPARKQPAPEQSGPDFYEVLGIWWMLTE